MKNLFLKSVYTDMFVYITKVESVKSSPPR